MNLVAALLLVVCDTQAAPPSALDAARPFDAAALAPPGVTLYLHIEGGADLRARLADRPIARWARSVLAGGEVGRAWGELTAATRLDAAGLFDACLGRRATLLIRQREQAVEWAVVTEIDPDQITQILVRLKPRVLGPRHQTAMLELPEQELVLARRGRLLIVGPQGRSELFEEVIDRLHQPQQPSLAADPSIVEACGLGPGRVGLFVRHELPMGGWSAAVADWQAGRIDVRHIARFENPPFTGRPPEAEWDRSVLDVFEEQVVVAFAEPTETGAGLLEAFLQASLGQAAIGEALRAQLGPRRITAVGDRDGRLHDPPFDLLYPTVARLYEIKGPAAGAERVAEQMDGQMVEVVLALNRLGQAKERVNFHLDVPDLALFAPGRPRSVDLAPAARWLLGDWPVASTVSLNWTVVTAPQESWLIVATEPQLLTEMARTITQRPAAAPKLGRWANCGTLTGRRLAWQLRSLSEQAAVFAPPPDVDVFREVVLTLSELADGVERCRWQLGRPSVDSMRLDAEVILSPPVSSELFRAPRSGLRPNPRSGTAAPE